jgi:hypothetical protein
MRLGQAEQILAIEKDGKQLDEVVVTAEFFDFVQNYLPYSAGRCAAESLGLEAFVYDCDAKLGRRIVAVAVVVVILRIVDRTNVTTSFEAFIWRPVESCGPIADGINEIARVKETRVELMGQELTDALQY